MNPIAFTIGNIEIRCYALFILVGVLLAFFIIKKEAKRFNIKSDFIFNLCFWAIIFGFIGARVYYVIFNWDYYSQNMIEILEVWQGGLAIHGGLIAGIITIYLYTTKYKARTINPIRLLSAVLNLFLIVILLSFTSFVSEIISISFQYITIRRIRLITGYII